MAEDAVVDSHGLRVQIERGADVESAELDAALEQLAKAVANLDTPTPLESDDVVGFRFDLKQTSGLRVGDAMGGLPKFGKAELAWCLGRCGSNSGDDCVNYCWIEG